MQPFDLAFDGINAGVEALFSLPNIALWFAFALLGWCAWIIIDNARRHYLPFSRALELRLAATDVVEASADTEQTRLAFAAAFPRIDAILAERDAGAAGLRHAWLQYRDTLLDQDEVPLRFTARPEEYFLHLGDETRVLAWWANIFVAIGLTFTFLGIVAALLKAVQAMGASADPANMQIALVGLLHITAAKFWTSIGGVLSSIILRVFDRRWHSRNQRGLELLCARIEAGTRYVPPQALAAEQLVELRRQTEALAKRGDAAPSAAEGMDEAASQRIAEAAHQFASVSERLAATIESLDGRVGGIVAQASTGIGETLGRAIKHGTDAADAQGQILASAGEEVRGLLNTLAKVAAEMGTVFAAVRASAQTIERSVGVTQDMVDRLQRDAIRSDEAARTLVTGLEETSRTATLAWQGYSERFESIDVALARALEQIHGASAEHAALLTQQVGRIDTALAQAVDRLAGALAVMGDLVSVLDDLRAEPRPDQRRAR
jgi:hypothetical protein